VSAWAGWERVDFTRIAAAASVDFTLFTKYPLFLAQKPAGAGYADIPGMTPKPSTNNAASEQRLVSEPTKSIVRCCEQRKRREDQAASLRETQRIRIKLGN
jgi:hypothetical protein